MCMMLTVSCRVHVCCLMPRSFATLFQWWKRRGGSASERRGGISWLGDSSYLLTAFRGRLALGWRGGDEPSHVDAVSGRRRGWSSFLGCYRGEVASQRRASEAEEEGRKGRTSSASKEETEPFLGGCGGGGGMPVDTYLRSVYVSNRGRGDSERGPWQSSFLRRNTTREHLLTSTSGLSSSSGPMSGEAPNPAVAPRTSPAASSAACSNGEMSALARAFEKKVSASAS